MELILQRKLALFNNKYIIHKGDEELYFVHSDTFAMASTIKLQNTQTQYVRTIISGEFGFFNWKFHIQRLYDDYKTLTLKTTTIWKKEFECFHNEDKYLVIPINQKEYTFLKNDTVVAKMEDISAFFESSKKYQLIINDEKSDLDLIISFAIAMDKTAIDSED